jgi:hypothetical protein
VNLLAPLDYVNRATSETTDSEHAKLYDGEADVLKRDFTGNDFTAWVYDLFRPDEPYTDRGVHPTGIGVDRYRTHEDLTPEMLDYVGKMGQRQWLNFVSPFMVGIRSIKVSPSLRFNFAMRHYLTSFGDDIQMELFYRYKKHLGQIVLHRYSNLGSSFPGLEARNTVSSLGLAKGKRLLLDTRGMLWVQPKDQAFRTSKGSLGGLASISASYRNTSIWNPYVELETKSRGWVAGNPFLTEKLSVRIGVRAMIGF